MKYVIFKWMKRIFFSFCAVLLLHGLVNAQGEVNDPDIRSVKLYQAGDQVSFPIIPLGNMNGLELHFDDLSNRVKNYYYTFQLCNADWSPSILRSFDYIKGFQNVRISNYRNSSLASTRYIHYQAQVPDKLTIVGIYKTGIEQYDKTFAIGDMKLIRRLNSWGDTEIGGYEVFLNDYKEMDAVSFSIFENENFPTLWETKTSREIYPDIFDWLEIQDTNQNILIAIMTIIAVINLITCLIILVLERLRMIGILKALGASNWSVQKIFLFHSAIITLTGIVIGTAFALGLLWLQQTTGFIHLPEDAYYMDKASVKIVWWQVILVISGTLLVSTLVLLIPSVIVRKVRPIRAIRFS